MDRVWSTLLTTRLLRAINDIQRKLRNEDQIRSKKRVFCSFIPLQGRACYLPSTTSLETRQFNVAYSSGFKRKRKLKLEKLGFGTRGTCLVDLSVCFESSVCKL